MKTFGISPVEVTAAGDSSISIDDGTATLLTIPAGDYLNMDLAAAIQTQIDASPEIGLGTVSVTTTSTRTDRRVLGTILRELERCRWTCSVTSSVRR